MGLKDKIHKIKVDRRNKKIAKEREAVEIYKSTELAKEMESMKDEIEGFYRRNPLISGELAMQVKMIHTEGEALDEQIKKVGDKKLEEAREKIFHATEGMLLKNFIDTMRKEYAILKLSNLWPKN